MNRMSCSDDSGHTLVELLVVILLLGFIALGIGGGIHFGTRVWEVSEQRISRNDEAAHAQAILRDVLGSALPRRVGGFVTFEGRYNHLAFDAEAPAAAGTSGLARVELDVVLSSGQRQLRLRVYPIDEPANVREAILVKDMGVVEFAFLDAGEAVPSWLASWRDRKNLPDAVRLTAHGSTANAPWSYFVAQLPLDQFGYCGWDPVSGECRENYGPPAAE